MRHVACLLLLTAAMHAAADEARRLDAVQVTARRAQVAVEAVAVQGAVAIERIGAAHAAEQLDRLPGLWVSRGSAQEQLLAIRSPVLTGVGACGAFLLLEDGVPIRPAGFCNANQLFELATELAGRIEVLRGPGSAVHGSNALHGVIALQPPAIEAGGSGLRVEQGPHRWRRAFVEVSDGEAWRLDAVAVATDSFRVDEGYRQGKLLAQWQAPAASGAPRFLLSASRLDQDTAGFVAGLDAYRDARRRSNQNPEAFRDARAARLSGRWQWALADGAELGLTGYARHDAMRFLQHFAPGQPLEDNGSDSVGLQWLWRRDEGARPQFGIDVEHARGTLLERQPQPLTTGSAAQQAIRPPGRHYDYAVESTLLAAFGQWTWTLAPRWELSAGLRAETLRYGYDNRMAAGNLREDGTPCGFGGCLFNRPADRDDRFNDANGQLGLRFEAAPGHALVARLARAFRVPQAGELYRLQRGQDVAALSPEVLEGVELGWRHRGAALALEVDGYAYRKRAVILRDALGFNVSDGRTRHRGVEANLRWQPHATWWLEADAGYAIQRYAFDRDAAGGESIESGNEIDSAPRWLGGARLGVDLDAERGVELEWRHQGGYFLDAANSARYPGHDLLHLRGWWRLDARWSLSARLLNLTDRRYAERADLAFGEFRYFPGAGRALFLALAWRASGN